MAVLKLIRTAILYAVISIVLTSLFVGTVYAWAMRGWPNAELIKTFWWVTFPFMTILVWSVHMLFGATPPPRKVKVVREPSPASLATTLRPSGQRVASPTLSPVERDDADDLSQSPEDEL